jgi:hypothetical protein
VRTLLRGATVFVDGEPIGAPRGSYLRRPLKLVEHVAEAGMRSSIGAV